MAAGPVLPWVSFWQCNWKHYVTERQWQAIGISDIISSSNGLQTPLTFAGSGSGRVNITGTANTWTGNINVTGGEVRFTAATSLGNAANTITVDGGRFGIANGGTVDLSARSIYLAQLLVLRLVRPGQGRF